MTPTKPSPCKDCLSRYIGCHDHCVPYQAFRQEREAYLNDRYREGTWYGARLPKTQKAMREYQRKSRSH